MKYSYVRHLCCMGVMIFMFVVVPWVNAAKSSTQKVSDHPNFIFIAVDDLNIYNSILGEEPESFLKKIYPHASKRKTVLKRLTPNLDRLAKQSLVFSHTYSAAPLCGPSRTALLTGVPPHVSGYYQHDRHFRAYKTLTKITTLPQLLKKNGYYTVGTGKVFHKGRSYLDRGYFSDWPDRLYSWSDWVETHSGTGSRVRTAKPVKESVSKYWYDNEGKAPRFSRFGVTSVTTEQSNDYINAQFAAELITKGRATLKDVYGETRQIELPENQPYFIAAGIFAPHLPWIVEQKYYDLFPLSDMNITRALRDWVKSDINDLSGNRQQFITGSHFNKMLGQGVDQEGIEGDLNAWKAFVQAYLATIAYADTVLGSLIDAIENNPQRDNTVVVLWSDHGYHLGDKGREGKATLWESANRANMMILDPRLKTHHAGKRTRATVSLQDIYPTLIRRAGIARPKHLHGYDLSPLLQNPGMHWPHGVLNTHGEGNHALRTSQYRYIRYQSGERELYKIDEDAYEENNLIKDQAFKKVAAALDKQLEDRLSMKGLQYPKF